MTASTATPDLPALAARLTGELHFDATMRKLYATDASEYQELPVAVALPKTEADIRELIAFANRHGFSKHTPALPLYTRRDALDCLGRIHAEP
ncbi:MAG TPA: hypothetical protein PLG56_06005, partial [Lacunisphaera sp.]|nr:hypothetical protein [Lacunisphaera sp.]